MSEKPNYYSILTANVRYDNRLSDSEKLLFAEITSLTQASGECWASNDYFAKLYNVSNVTISRRVSKLKNLGYIHVKMIYREGTKEILRRIIKIDTTYGQNCIEGIIKIDTTPIIKIDKENIASKSNITSINNKPYSPLEAFELFWNLYPKKNGKKPSSEKFLKLIEKSPELAEVIINDLIARKQTTTWTKDNGKYVPNATTYLNQERWQDELELPQHSELKLKLKQY